AGWESYQYGIFHLSKAKCHNHGGPISNDRKYPCWSDVFFSLQYPISRPARLNNNSSSQTIHPAGPPAPSQYSNRTQKEENRQRNSNTRQTIHTAGPPAAAQYANSTIKKENRPILSSVAYDSVAERRR